MLNIIVLIFKNLKTYKFTSTYYRYIRSIEVDKLLTDGKLIQTQMIRHMPDCPLISPVPYPNAQEQNHCDRASVLLKCQNMGSKVNIGCPTSKIARLVGFFSRNVAKETIREIFAGVRFTECPVLSESAFSLSTFLASCLHPGFIATEILSCTKPFGPGELFLDVGIKFVQNTESVYLLNALEFSIESLVDLAFRVVVLECTAGLLTIHNNGFLKIFHLNKAEAQLVKKELAPSLILILQKKTQSCVDHLGQEFSVVKAKRPIFLAFLKLQMSVELDSLTVDIFPMPQMPICLADHSHWYSYVLQPALTPSVSQLC